jgi:hypothetical protein
MQKLVEPEFLAFPFRVTREGVDASSREDHVREQIEQVLFTDPQERVFRPHFGAGVRQLVFEPNASAIWKIAYKRLVSSLREALQGEVDPKTLDVEVQGQDEELVLIVSYKLAAIDRFERHQFQIDGDAFG